jgi:hypothetical protein
MYVEQWTIGSALSVAMEQFKKFAAPVLIAMIPSYSPWGEGTHPA